MTRVVLLAGPSGSGKSRVARLVGATPVRLEDFYRDHDAPDLPQVAGLVDWDDPRTWNAVGAATALHALAEAGHATVPSYSIPESRRTGAHELVVGPTDLVVAEGIFAVELLAHCRAAGVPVEAYYLDRNRTLVAGLRLRRDLAQRRKPPLVLLRRGVDLWRRQPGLRAAAVAAGFTPLSMRAALARLNGTPR